MTTKIDPLGFGFLATGLSRLVRAEFDRRIGEAGLGLTPGEARALVHAARAGPVRQIIIAENMGIEAMTLTAYLDRLEARGLVTREADPADRRAKLVQLTEAADGVLAVIKSITDGMRRTAAGSMPAAEWNQFLTTLQTVYQNFAEARSEPACQNEDTAA